MKNDDKNQVSTLQQIYTFWTIKLHKKLLFIEASIIFFD